MPDMTDAARIEELGTTIYGLAMEVTSILKFFDDIDWQAAKELPEAETGKVYGHAEPLAKALVDIGMRLNRRACGDSHERNGEPLVLLATERGFKFCHFEDGDRSLCSLQKSSIATEDRIWLGRDNLDRMHLTRPMVAALLPHLRRFVETGEL